MEASFHTAIDLPWTKMDPVLLGQVPAGQPTPDRYLLVSEREVPRLRVDIYVDTEEARVFWDAVVWRNWLAVGFGDRAYLIGMLGQPTLFIPLGGYFGHLYPGDGHLLIASCDRLVCVDSLGEVVWTSVPLGIDGVIVNSVDGGIVTGEGEWDPPGGWLPFRLDAITGLAIDLSW